MKFKDALDIDVGEREQFHVFYKRSFCGRLKKGEKATEVNVKKLIIEHNGFYVCEVNSSFDWAVDLELRDLDFKYEKRSFEDGIQSKQAEIDELQKRIDELEWFVKSVINWDAHPKDLELNSGSWGVRDFYRDYAIRILKGEDTK